MQRALAPCRALGTRSSHAALRRSHVRALATRPQAAAAAADGEASKPLVLITGANTGLGKRAALELSRDKQCRVVGAVRSLARGEAAATELREAGGDMAVMELDLASFASVRAFAAAFKEAYGGSVGGGFVLLNNAGIMAPPSRTLTVDGHEAQLGVNHLGHYLLTDLLMDTLVAAPAARIINVASTAHLFGSIRFDNLQSEGFFGYPALGWSAYGQSKLCNILFTYEMHRRLRRAGIDHVDVNAIHPGVVDTGALPALAAMLAQQCCMLPCQSRSLRLLTAQRSARRRPAAQPAHQPVGAHEGAGRHHQRGAGCGWAREARFRCVAARRERQILCGAESRRAGRAPRDAQQPREL